MFSRRARRLRSLLIGCVRRHWTSSRCRVPQRRSGTRLLRDRTRMVASPLVTLGVRRSILPELPGRIDRGVEVDTTIADLLAADAPVAIGVSGGKDSCAAAIATVEHLRSIGHRGEVVL